MPLTNQTKTLLTVVVVLLLVYFIYKNQSGAVHNEGALDYNSEDEQQKVNVVVEDDAENN